MSKVNVGDILEGVVTGIEDYGIFLSFKNGASGLIHISEISSSFVRDTSDYARIGDKLTVKVLSIDDDSHYKLSLKELSDSIKLKKKMKICETPSGFNTLSVKLDEWIRSFSLKK